MQVKIKLGQLFTKDNFYIFASIILFIGCTAFVAFRGYRCFDKYLKKPKNSEISFESSKNHPFPSFTLCASENASYNDDLMKECQLERSEYISGAQWIGKGGLNCTDPKYLHNRVAAYSEDLEIEQIWIMTYALSNNTYDFRPNNWSIFEWKLALFNPSFRCFTFTIPNTIVREGIKDVVIYSKKFYALYLHKEGTFSAPIPGSSLRAKYADLYRASVIHESIELLNYDGKKCNMESEYNYDKCKQDFIYKESMERFGCTTPFGLELDKICTGQNKSLEANGIFWEIFDKQITQCPYPCHFLMKQITSTNYDSNDSGEIWLRFDEYIKVTTSTHGYTELELLAELGGYVGLFLGLSVFDLRLVFNKILNIFMPN